MFFDKFVYRIINARDIHFTTMDETVSIFNIWVGKLDQLFLSLGMTEGLTIFVRTFLVAVLILGLAFLADFITRRLIFNGIKSLIKRTKTKLDDILIERRVLHRVAHVVPALLIFFTAQFVFNDYPLFEAIFERVALVYIVLMVALAIDSFLNALHAMYLTLPIAAGRSIKGYVQVVKIIVYFIGIILITAILIDSLQHQMKSRRVLVAKKS